MHTQRDTVIPQNFSPKMVVFETKFDEKFFVGFCDELQTFSHFQVTKNDCVYQESNM